MIYSSSSGLLFKSINYSNIQFNIDSKNSFLLYSSFSLSITPSSQNYSRIQFNLLKNKILTLESNILLKKAFKNGCIYYNSLTSFNISGKMRIPLFYRNDWYFENLLENMSWK